MPATVTVRPMDLAESQVPVMTGFPVFEVTASMVGAVRGAGGAATVTAPASENFVTLPAASVTEKFKSYLPGAN